MKKKNEMTECKNPSLSMKINLESIKLEINFHEVILTIFELIDVEVLISIKYFELTKL